jgi:hypothetical protein
MFRPTPGRLFYLLVGLVIGALALAVYVSVAGIPAVLAGLSTSQTAVAQPKVPTEFSATTLGRVLSANQAQSKAGVTVRVNSLELYGDGFSLTYSVLSGQPGEPAQVLQPEGFTVVDDRGGAYRLSALGSASSLAPGMSTGYLAYTPALDPNAKALTVTVPHLLVVSGVATESTTPRIVDGPWQLSVPLR